MKHEVTTYNTKKMLAEALKKAMKTKSFSKITVSEIIKESGVNRKGKHENFHGNVHFSRPSHTRFTSRSQYISLDNIIVCFFLEKVNPQS